MLCHRCGLSTSENDNICTRCHLFYAEKNAYIRKPVTQIRTAKRLMRYAISFLLFAVLFGIIGILIKKFSYTNNFLFALGGGFVGIIAKALSRRIRGVLYKYQLTSATRQLHLNINNALKKHEPDKKNASIDSESLAVYGLALVLKGDVDSGLKRITQAVVEGSKSIDTKNNLGVALALNNDLDGAIASWQKCINSADKHFPSKFNYAIAQLSKKNYDVVIQILSEFDDVKTSEFASKIPYYLGIALLKKGSIAEAHVKFEEAALIDPSNGDIQNNIGICSYLLGDEDDGILKFQKAQKVEKGHLLSICNLGRIYLNEGSLDKAIASSEYALWLDTNSVCARTTHALTIFALGNLDTALNELEHLSKLIKTDYELHYQLGRLYLDKNESDKGIEQLKIALKVEPDAVEVMSHLGVVSQLKKRFEESRRMYLGVLEKESNNVRTLINLALNYLDNNNWDKALELLQKAQELSPDLPEVYFNIGCALEMKGKSVEAVENYNKAIEMDKKYLPAKFNFALCCLSAESNTNAATELEEILEINPKFGLAHFMLGCAAQQKNNLIEALKHWEFAKKHDVKIPDLYINLGISYYIKDKIDLAIANFQNVIRVRDGNAQDYNNLALAQIKNKNIPEAIKAFEKSLSMEPNNPVTHLNLGLAYYFNKDIEKATYEWATVGRLDPEYALKRRNIETATYDDTQAAFPVINFNSYSLKLAPEYPDSPLKLIPAESPDPWMIDTRDKDLAAVPEIKQRINKIRKASRMYKMY